MAEALATGMRYMQQWWKGICRASWDGAGNIW